MTKPMTLEEAVCAWRTVSRFPSQVNLAVVVETLAAHAERTIAARSGEPEAVRAFRDPNTRSWSHAEEVCQYIDRLTAYVERVRECVVSAKQAAQDRVYQGCCGRGTYECCGEPEPCWTEADQQIMSLVADILAALGES